MRFKLKVILLVIFLLFFSNLASANENILPLTEVRPGMSGTGRTVLRGTEIEEFDVEVLSILDEPALSHDLILIETSGEVIEEAGGISSGMSGSPIYIDGKLIGAIGYGWQMADHKIGMVTPIESMLEIFDFDDILDGKKELELSKPLQIGDSSYKRIKFSNENELVSEETLLATPVNTPLMVSGFSGRSKKMVGDIFSEYNMELAPVGGGIVDEPSISTELEPGSAVAAQLVRGDINVSAVGTMTYRDDDKVVAFAHPFLSQGKADYMLSSAYIHKMVSSVQMPFKIGSPTELKGIITQDRSAGIAGVIGEYPKVIAMEINVIDRNLGKADKYNLQIVQNEALLEELSLASALQAIDNTIDRQGAGTSKVKMEIFANNLEDNVISKENYFYSGNDIAAVSLLDYVTLLGLLVNNPYKEINLANIKLNIEIEESNKVALVKDIILENEEARPGETIKGEVILQPYRSEPVTEKVSIEIPDDIEAGIFDITAFSGQEANYERLYRMQYEEEAEEPEISSMNDLLNLFQEQKKNNQLVVELLPSYMTPYENDNGDSKDYENSQEREDMEDMEDEEDEEVIDNNNDYSYFEKIIDSNYVLEGSTSQEIMILNNNDKEENNNEDEY